MVRGLRQGGDERGSAAPEASSRPRTPVPESDALTDHEDFVEVHASHGSSPLDGSFGP